MSKSLVGVLREELVRGLPLTFRGPDLVDGNNSSKVTSTIAVMLSPGESVVAPSLPRIADVWKPCSEERTRATLLRKPELLTGLSAGFWGAEGSLVEP